MNRWTQADIDRVQNKTGAKPAATSLQKMQALGRMKAGKMNKTEKHYQDLLEVKKHNGEVLWYLFEPMNLRLADNCYYKIDFLVLKSDMTLEAVDVKGFWTDDALVKIKAAAERFPFKFIGAMLKKGDWEIREF